MFRLPPLIVAAILSCYALLGQRMLLRAVALGMFVGYPVFQATPNLRSAIYVEEVVFGIAFAPWVFGVIRKKKRERTLSISGMHIHLALIMAYALVITAVRYENVLTYGGVPIRILLTAVRFGGLALAFLIPASTGLCRDEFGSILRFLLVGFQILAVLAALEFWGIISLPSLYLTDEPSVPLEAGFGGFNRASTGTLGQLGMFLTILLIRLRKLDWRIGAASITSFVWLIITSLSRTTLVSVSVFLLLLLAMGRRDRVQNLILVLTCTGAGLLMAHYHAPVVFRVEAISRVITNPEGDRRLYGWVSGLEFLRKDLVTALIGGGYDSWADVMGRVTGLSSGHNVYLHSWAELGLVGGLIYLALFARIGWLFLHNMLRGRGDTQQIGTLSLCLMISLLVGNFTADLFYPVPTMLSCLHMIMFLFGLLVARLRVPLTGAVAG